MVATLIQNSVLGYGDSGLPAMCWLRAFRSEAGLVVVLTELKQNPGMSVTNDAEGAIKNACRFLGIQPDEALFLEHYGPASYEVEESHRFARVRISGTGRAEFEHMPLDAVSALLGGEALAQDAPLL